LLSGDQFGNVAPTLLIPFTICFLLLPSAFMVNTLTPPLRVSGVTDLSAVRRDRRIVSLSQHCQIGAIRSDAGHLGFSAVHSKNDPLAIRGSLPAWHVTDGRAWTKRKSLQPEFVLPPQRVDNLLRPAFQLWQIRRQIGELQPPAVELTAPRYHEASDGDPERR
jgi:hypothetical protein